MARAPQPAGFSAVPYDHIPLLPVTSSQLKAVGYDARRHILAAQFLHGAQAVYHYPNVTPELHAAFAASDSKGEFFGKHIKPLAFEKYPATVLQELSEAADTPMTIAQALQGVEYGRDVIPEEIEARAKAAGILIVCGASDDLVEFYGAWRDEAGAYDGGTVLIDAVGVLPDWDSIDTEEEGAEYHARKARAGTIKALWSPKPEDAGGLINVSWAYKTDIPHHTFDVMEDGEVYCRGIVFNVADIHQPA